MMLRNFRKNCSMLDLLHFSLSPWKRLNSYLFTKEKKIKYIHVDLRNSSNSFSVMLTLHKGHRNTPVCVRFTSLDQCFKLRLILDDLRRSILQGGCFCSNKYVYFNRQCQYWSTLEETVWINIIFVKVNLD